MWMLCSLLPQVVVTPLPSIMSAPIKKTASGFEGTDAPLHKIRITLTSRKVKELEKVCEVKEHKEAHSQAHAAAAVSSSSCSAAPHTSKPKAPTKVRVGSPLMFRRSL
jgi:hypothetical protein